MAGVTLGPSEAWSVVTALGVYLSDYEKVRQAALDAGQVTAAQLLGQRLSEVSATRHRMIQLLSE